VPFSSVLAATGGWSSVFWAAAILNLTAAAMALLVLKPLRARFASASFQSAEQALPADL
jgi:OFA family oxalate/formate antiporter-like MFS transporter